ncbi:hypothetical protein pEaSNUABM37_00249 [Erwinia phage pEa_SNUABM_37]|nr:hypothetical protein pEaSNUABM37_00249 [Erwinia phage pEa_SNUABM_37]QXO10717.1 hypothetical protein pEaSNUABM48_00249 [Erwinia phage pEa_SNUABM_48]
MLDQIKRTVADDIDLPAVNLHTINDVVYELFNYCTDRVNIVDTDPEYQGLYQPFYEALNEMLLMNNIPLLSVSNLLVDGPERWTIVLILNTLRGESYGL